MSSRSAAVSLLSCLLFVTGCVEPVKLAVTPVAPTSVPIVERPCQTDCLASATPDLRIAAPKGEEFLWIKTSPDGKTLIASIAPIPAGKKPREIASLPIAFAAIDAESGSERWRIRLAPNARVAADETYFIGSDKVALLTSAGFLFTNTFFVLDLASGREVWRTPPAVGTGEPVHSVVYDAERQYFLIGSMTMQVVDANTGQVLATRPSFHKGNNRRVTGGQPSFLGEDLYLYDFGLVRVGREQKKFVWGRRFVNFAKDDYTGANIGLAIAGALLGSYNSGNIPPDYLVGRGPEPVRVQDRVVTAGVGVVHCLNEADGTPLWSRDLAVPQIARLVVRGDRVYALAGGNYLFWHGRQGMSIREPLRYGLYALNVSDGSPVAGFASPFNPNEAGQAISAAEVEKYDEGDAFEEEEDWGDLKQKAAPAAGAPAAPAPDTRAFSKTRLVAMEPLSDGLLVATADDVVVLDPDGRELGRYPLNDIGRVTAVTSCGESVVVRTRDGVAVFDRSDGHKLWQKKIERGDAVELMSGGPVPLIRTEPWKEFRDAEAKHFGGELFWVCEKRDVVVVPERGSRLIALNVRDGSGAWQLPIRTRVALDFHTRPAQLVTTNGTEAEVFTIP